MKAIYCPAYGPAHLLQLKEVPVPEPKADEVLVRVMYSSVNAYDWHFYTGEPLLARFSFGLLRPNPSILGADVSGIVEKTGRHVSAFQPGDRVVGEVTSGAWAEYVCVRAERLTSLPVSVSLEQAAGMPMAGQTALQGLRNHARVQAGQKVLINGATGGVGTFSVQIAKILGAEVWAVCRTGNMELVKSLGADHIIDYTREDFRQMNMQWDVVLDNVGNITRRQYEPLLQPDGTGIMIGFQNMKTLMGIMLRQRKKSGSGKPRVFSFTAEPNAADMAQLVAWAASGQLRSVITKRFPLTEAAKAAALQQEGHVQGKLVLEIA